MNKKEIINRINQRLQEKLGEDFKPIIPNLSNFWIDSRNNNYMRLSEFGYKMFQLAEIKSYKVDVDPELYFTSKFILNLNAVIKDPYFLDQNSIILYNQRTAIELILFEGKLDNFIQTKISHLKKLVDTD